MTDLAFQALIRRVSADGRVQWGVEPLYNEVCRRQRRQGRVQGVSGRPSPAILLSVGIVGLSRGTGAGLSRNAASALFVAGTHGMP